MMGRQTFRITLTQGLNRQIRRMCEYLGYAVVALQRVRIMNIRLDKLALGKWRHLSEAEVSLLMESVNDSNKVNSESKPAAHRKKAAAHKQAPAHPKSGFTKDKPPVLKPICLIIPPMKGSCAASLPSAIILSPIVLMKTGAV